MKQDKPDKRKHIKTDKSKLEEQDYEKLKQQVKEYLAGWQRAQADYQNLKKEMEIKVGSIREFAKGALLIDFLPIYTNLLSAFEHIPESDKSKDWAEGFKHIKKQLEDFLVSQGLEKISTVGQTFNHNVHDAVETRWVKDKPEGLILQEVSPGYKLAGNILIHPKVAVNSRGNNL